jgi:DNA-binding HxlR family transcriptional regulator
MEYQKKCKAGLINQSEIATIQRKLKCVMSSLKRTCIINPYATLIDLPEDLPQPRKTLLLLLNFIDIITFFFQYQRDTIADTGTGEVMLKTHPDDIKLAFKLLKNSLFRRADELSTTARGFFCWLQKFLKEAKTNQFTALDVRKIKRIHPRTLNRYLQELNLFNYIQIVGGNKYKGGYLYKITNLDEDNTLNNSIEQALKATLEKIDAEHSRTVSQNPQTNTQSTENKRNKSKTQTE